MQENPTEPKLAIQPHAQIYVESFGVTRQGTVVKQIDDNHVMFILSDYPGVLYSAAIKDIRLKVSEICIRESNAIKCDHLGSYLPDDRLRISEANSDERNQQRSKGE
jgi:hypothetical protein